MYQNKPEAIYEDHIYAGMPHILSGREGTGKTSNALQISKEILEAHPDKMAFWFATEGTAADTLHKTIDTGLPEDGRFSFAVKGDEREFVFDFRTEADRELLDRLLAEAPMPVIAVFVDSIRGMTSSNPNDEETGAIMRKVNAIVCDKHRAALIYLHHNNKKKDASWLDQVTGTTAITAAARIVLMVLPNTKYSRKIVVAKCNVAAEIQPLMSVRHGNQITIYPESDETEEPESKTELAEQILMEAFNGGKERFARDIYKLGETQGVSAELLKRVKANLGIKARQTRDGWMWCVRA